MAAMASEGGEAGKVGAKEWGMFGARSSIGGTSIAEGERFSRRDSDRKQPPPHVPYHDEAIKK
jgi:hypothetical protein